MRILFFLLLFLASITTWAAPGPPTGFAVSAYPMNHYLRWGNQYTADKIFIERKLGAGSYSRIVTLGGTITEYSDSTIGFTDGGSYTYKVTASDNAETTTFASSEVAITCVIVPPSIPANFTLTEYAGNHYLRWANKYIPEKIFIERKASGGAYSTIATLAGTARDYSDDTASLSHGTTYLYRVSASDNAETAVFTTAELSILCSKNSIIHPQRTYDWANNAGVPGDIPARTVIYCNVKVSIPGSALVAVGDGVADDAPAINAAIRSAADNQGTAAGKVIYLPTGVYKCNSAINFNGVNWAANNITLRGDGPGLTIIRPGYTSTTGFINLGNFAEQGTLRNITAGNVAGSTALTVDVVGGATAGTLLYTRDDTANPNTYEGWVKYTSNPGNGMMAASVGLIRGVHLVTSVSGNTVNITPPVVYTSQIAPIWRYLQDFYRMRSTGIEDLTVDGNGQVGYNIYFNQTYGCWLKNVKSLTCKNSHFRVFMSSRGTIRGCWTDGAVAYTPNASIGLFIESHVTGFLIEDNIIERAFPSIEMNLGASGNVIAYNYTYDERADTDVLFPTIDANHGAHNVYNLFEGNITSGIMSDGYFGSSQYGVCLRNWFRGQGVFSQNFSRCVWLTHWSYHWTFLGNVLGYPGFAYTHYDPTVSGYPGAYPNRIIWGVGYPNMGNNTFSGSIPTTKFGPTLAYYSAFDNETRTLVIRHRNYDFMNGAIVDDARISNTTVPDSLYLSAKPSWYVNGAWPPIGPSDDVPSSTTTPSKHQAFNRRWGLTYNPPTPPEVSAKLGVKKFKF